MRYKKRETAYYRIRADLFWGILFCILLLSIWGIYVYDKSLNQEKINISEHENQTRVEVTYEGWYSELSDSAQCLLCTECVLEETDRKYDSDNIGLVLLNSWTILDFQLKDYNRTEDDIEVPKDSGIRYGYTDEISYLTTSEPARGMAKIRLTLPEHCQTDKHFVRQNLCQPCLDKVAASLSFWKWEKEEKEALPFCLIDFQTSEIYPVQDWYRSYFIRDYWIELDFEDMDVCVKAYYLPLRLAELPLLTAPAHC